MTDFIRSILQNAAVATAAATAAHAATSSATATSTAARPVNQIQIPPNMVTAAIAQPSSAMAAAVEKQRLIKLEAPSLPNPMTATPPTLATVSVAPATTISISADASKAQRAARRDMVNARRDKRKAMALTTPGPSSTSSPSRASTSGADDEDSADDDEDVVDADDKTKKMKTGIASSLAVVGGLGTETTARKSLSASLPPTPGLLFTPEIDAAGEERLRAMEAQLETLDPDSKEAKKKRRLIRNRMSAQLHRERKKAYVGQLEEQLLEKDKELKLLQEKLARMMDESAKLQQQLATTVIKTEAPSSEVVAPSTAPAAPTPKVVEPVPIKIEDEVVIKEEPTAWDAPWPLDDPASGSWDFAGLEDAEMADVETAELLRDFDYPFASLADAYAEDLAKNAASPTPEIHAAKKNLAMMAAVMFSVSFFGNSPSFYNVTPGSNFSSMFDANPPKEFSQMSVASRIVACLEKTSWKEFRDVSSWLSAAAAAKADKTETVDAVSTPGPVNSPSAQSDVTDSSGSCDSPGTMDVDAMGGGCGLADSLDEFVYPVEDPFASAAVPDADWLADDLTDVDEVLEKTAAGDVDDAIADVVLSEALLTKQQKRHESSSLTARLYDKLTALWREKNQVLLTVLNDKKEVTRRSIADLSTIREGLQSGDFFTKVFGAREEEAGVTVTEDASVTFLYPMSAFSTKDAAGLSGAFRTSGCEVDPMFLEVSCQMNAPGPVAMKM